MTTATCPLHPHLVTLIDDYRRAHVRPEHPLLLPRENGRPLDRHTVTRLINKAAASAGLGHIHPHQLRHTLATQAINRGMNLEAIAALLGHHSLDMTLRYARIANRTVAEEYFAVTDKVEALYGQPISLPAEAAGPKMTKLRREHYRMLGNGYCARPSQLDCAFESVCETCTYFQPHYRVPAHSNANTTTPKPNNRPDASNCSSASSSTSTPPKHHDPLDKDHPHNAADRTCDTVWAGRSVAAIRSVWTVVAEVGLQVGGARFRYVGLEPVAVQGINLVRMVACPLNPVSHLPVFVVGCRGLKRVTVDADLGRVFPGGDLFGERLDPDVFGEAEVGFGHGRCPFLLAAGLFFQRGDVPLVVESSAHLKLSEDVSQLVFECPPSAVRARADR